MIPQPIKWGGVARHVGVAILSIVILGVLGFPSGVIFLANAIVWPARELWQHKPNYLEIFTHPQSLLEWAAPVAISLVVLA